MKININTLLGLAYIVMILSSNVLAIKEKARFNNKFSNKINASRQPDECPLAAQPRFNYWAFFYNMVFTAAGSISGDATAAITSAFKDKALEARCMATMEAGFNNKVKAVRAEVLQRVKTRSLKLAESVKTLGLTKEEAAQLLAVANNPRQLCKVRLEISDRQRKLYKEIQENSKQSKLFIQESKKNKWTWAQMKEEAVGPWYKFKDAIKLNVLDMIPNDGIVAPHLNRLEAIMTESEAQAQINNKDLPADLPSCSDLPENEKDFNDCGKAGFAANVVGAWRFIKEENSGITGQCIATFVTGALLSRLVSMGMESLIAMVTDIFGLFVIRILKIVYYVIRLIYFIYQAIKAVDINKVSEYWGKAAGSVFKIVYTAIIGRRKFKLLK